jgi:coatomer subunit beta'
MPLVNPLLTICRYTNSTNRLNYLVGDKVNTISHFDSPTYILGYLPRDGRIYICDKDLQVSSYSLSLAVVEYQTLVLRGELEAAQEIPIPQDQKTKIARFLEGQGFKEEALEISTDSEHRFDLALGLGKLDIALAIAEKEGAGDHKWRAVGDKALEGWDVKTAESCFWQAKDLGSLLLLYSASGDRDGLRKLAEKAKEAAAFNVQFECLWLLADVDACIQTLKDTGRFAEAVLFAQTYKPSAAPKAVQAWKESLEKDGKGRVARVLGVPPGLEGVEADEDLFPEWDEWLKIEGEGGVKLIDVEEAEDEEVEGDEEVEVGEAGVEDENDEEEAEE